MPHGRKNPVRTLKSKLSLAYTNIANSLAKQRNDELGKLSWCADAVPGNGSAKPAAKFRITAKYKTAACI